MVSALTIDKDNVAQIHCDYEDRDNAKALGARWDKVKKIWFLPYLTYDIMKKLDEHKVPLDIKAEELWKDLKFRFDNAEKIKKAQVNDLPNFNCDVKLYDHQKKTSCFGQSIGSYADLSDCGTGKTISTLSIISHNTTSNSQYKCLVVAPKSIIVPSWCEDAKLFKNIKIVPVMGSKKQKMEAFNKDANVYVTNYETMNQGFNFEDSFDMIVCDEAVRLKNPYAGWTKAIKKISRTIKHKIIISGLITPNNLQEIFAPFDIVEPHILGKSFYQFRNKYFAPNPFSYMNKEWVPKKGAHEAIMEKIKPYIIRHDKDECLDLPEKIQTVRQIDMSQKQREIYIGMAKSFIAEVKDKTITAVNAGAKIQKLQQITSGFLYTEEDNKSSTVFFNNNKQKELSNLLSGELTGKQVIVFCTYKGEIEMFKKEYPNDSAFIYGGQSDEEQKKAIEDFKNNNVRLLFANVKASKYGLTFTNCSDVIYYSLSYSLDDVYQSQERVHRIGQKKVCNYIYLNAKKTIDNRIYNAVMKKQSLNDMLFELIEDLKNKGD